MRDMIPFTYSGFHDVPLGIVLWYRGTVVLLTRDFNEELDNYEDEYSVYETPESAIEELARSSWAFSYEKDRKLLGRIPVTSVKFDSTRRKYLNPRFLDHLVQQTKAADAKPPVTIPPPLPVPKRENQ